MREFRTEEYYHIFNRGVEKRNIFMNGFDQGRFFGNLKEFNNKKGYYERDYLKRHNDMGRSRSFTSGTGSETSEGDKLIEIIAYCLNPNHYHLILKQLSENGITNFMRKLGTGYTNYFNKKHNHSGVIFQGPFKSKHIKSDRYLLWLSVYVNLNHEIHRLVNRKKVDKLWRWSSYREYTGRAKERLCDKEVVLGQFRNNPDEYREYCRRNLKRLVENKKFKKLFLE